MPTLKSVRAQIEKLKNEEKRLLETAMAGSVAKVKKLMASLGVTLEHLGGSVTSAVSKAVGSKPAAKRARAKRAGVGAAKYRDPATGATWSGFGRAPAWIADAKNRDAFLVGAKKESAAKKPVKATKAAPAKKGVKTAKPAVTAKNPAKPAAKKATPAKTAAPAKNAAKPAAKKAPAKKGARASKPAAAPVEAEAAAPVLNE